MKKPLKKEPILLTPGPVSLLPSVKKALSGAMEHHRSEEFKKTLMQVSADLKYIFQTRENVLILNSSGTGAMEAALSNVLSPKETVLCVCSGKFGERWREMAKSFGLKTQTLSVPWGQVVKAEQIDRALKKNKKIRALLISACETSTATEQPLKEISRILKKHPKVLFVVDGITGVGIMELPMDRWGIDVLIAGSQKGFMIPTGLSFIALSKKAWKTQKNSRLPKYYFDLEKERQAQKKQQTAFSSPVNLISALKESLKFIKARGLKNQIKKCQSLKKSTHVFCENLGLSLYSSRPANAVTAIKLPENFSAGEIKKNIQNKEGIVLAGGQGILKNQILRIGHLGPIKNSQHLRALKAIACELNKKEPLQFKKKQIHQALKKAKAVLESV